jgi:hypothetical protein
MIEHLRIVGFIAQRIHERLPKHVPIEDLYGAGVLGLLDAFGKFHAGGSQERIPTWLASLPSKCSLCASYTQRATSPKPRWPSDSACRYQTSRASWPGAPGNTFSSPGPLKAHRRSGPPLHTNRRKLGTDPIELLQTINGKVVPTKAVEGGQALLFHSFSTIAHQPCSSVVASGNFVCSRAPSTMPFINAERMWCSS